MTEAIKYLKAQDLGTYLGIEASSRGAITCPFHADTNPSATVAMDTASGHWLFRCHSTRCGVKGSIIDITMRMLGTTDTTAALRHLLARFKIEIDTGWKQKEEVILNANIAALNAIVTIKTQYPSLYRWIGRIAHDLIIKLGWAKSFLLSEKLKVGERAMYFISLREMERRTRGEDELPRQFGRHSQRVDRYCLLGLMRKVPDHEIPSEILQDARKRQGSRAHRIQFYSIPAYTDEVLARADERAGKLVTAGASVRGVSRALATDLLGQDIANEVYPQRSLHMRSSLDEFRKEVQSVVLELISTQGYATVSRIRDAMCAKAESVTHRRIERVLPGILARHGLLKMTSNKTMKERLCIAGAGYGKVILPRNGSYC